MNSSTRVFLATIGLLVLAFFSPLKPAFSAALPPACGTWGCEGIKDVIDDICFPSCDTWLTRITYYSNCCVASAPPQEESMSFRPTSGHYCGTDPNLLYTMCTQQHNPTACQILTTCSSTGNTVGKEDREMGSSIQKNEICSYGADPIHIPTGNMILPQTDVTFNSPFDGGFFFERFYNSRGTETSSMGFGWTHSYNIQLTQYSQSAQLGTLIPNPYLFKIKDETGRAYYFQNYAGNGIYQDRYTDASTVRIEAGNYVWRRTDGKVYTFHSTSGRLLNIRDKNGNVQSLTYDTSNRLASVFDQAFGRNLTFHYATNNKIDYILGPVTTAVPDGIWARYAYDANDNLISVTYADDENGTATGFKYIYQNPANHNLTSRTDLANKFISSWTYDAQDRAIENTTVNGREIALNYTNATSIVGTDAYGVNTTYNIQLSRWTNRVVKVTNPNGCTSCRQGITETTYDTTGRPTKNIYFNGRIDLFQNYDANNNPQMITIAQGTTDQKIIKIYYHPTIQSPMQVSEPSVFSSNHHRITILDYDDPAASGNTDAPNETPTTRIYRKIVEAYTHDLSGTIVRVKQTTIYEYNAKGQVTSVDGPVSGTTDKITFQYDATTGNLTSVIQPLVGTTTLQYDNAGNPIRSVDPNGIETLIAYDGKNNVVQNKVDGKTASRSINASGKVSSTTDRAGRTLLYNYTAAGLLDKITNPQGDYQKYVYDDKANVVSESLYDAGTLAFQQSYDYGTPATNSNLAPGKVWKTIVPNPDNTGVLETTYEYKNGNVSKVTSSDGSWETYSYDKLDRLTASETLQSGTTTTLKLSYTYDAHDNLISIKNLINTSQTVFTYDDFGRVVKEVSPETGTTKYVYDDANGFATKVDAKGQTEISNFDALGRIKAVLYEDQAQNVTYAYDQGTNAKGQLTGITDPSGSYTFTYNTLGNLTGSQQTVLGITKATAYMYDNSGLLTGMTYPGGRGINFQYNNAGELTAVTSIKGGVTKTLANNIVSMPFGPVKNLNFGNGSQLSRTFDRQYRLKTLTIPGKINLSYGYDNIGNVSTIQNFLQSSRNRSFGYDKAGRLTSATGTWGTLAYTYDSADNRKTETRNGTTKTYAYQGNTNLLSSISGSPATNFVYDANGNTISVGSRNLIYNIDNRVVEIKDNNVTVGQYVYNSRGQRVKATQGGATTLFLYDILGNIIGEMNVGGNLTKEYIYIGSDRLAAIDTVANSEYYFINDHQGAPNLVLNQQGTKVWDADYEPFGKANVLTGAFTNNFRFPGQFLDAATGLHYNYHRYYDPTIGRYLTADPIGLEGGINLFAYAYNSPTNFVDPDGKLAFLALLPIAYAAFEVSLSALDAYSTGSTLLNPCMSGKEKAISAGYFIIGALAPGGGYSTVGKAMQNSGRAGKQARLRSLLNDKTISSADKGWIKQEITSINRGQRTTIRVPPTKELAHQRGKEAKNGFGYEYSDLQDIDLHKLQHKFEGY